MEKNIHEISLGIPVELYEQLKAYADKTHRSVAGSVRQAVQELVSNES